MQLMTTAPLDERAARIIAVGKVLDEFRKLDPKMPIAQVQAFLLIALDSNMGMQDFAEMAGVRDSTASRYLLDLGAKRVDGDDALDLIIRGVDPTNPRRARYSLSRKGKALVAKIKVQSQKPIG